MFRWNASFHKEENIKLANRNNELLEQMKERDDEILDLKKQLIQTQTKKNKLPKIQQMDALKSQITALNKELKDVKHKNDEMRDLRRRVSAKTQNERYLVAEHQKRVDDLENELNEVKEHRDALDKECKRRKTQNERLAQKLKAHIDSDKFKDMQLKQAKHSFEQKEIEEDALLYDKNNEINALQAQIVDLQKEDAKHLADFNRKTKELNTKWKKSEKTNQEKQYANECQKEQIAALNDELIKEHQHEEALNFRISDWKAQNEQLQEKLDVYVGLHKDKEFELEQMQKEYDRTKKLNEQMMNDKKAQIACLKFKIGGLRAANEEHLKVFNRQTADLNQKLRESEKMNQESQQIIAELREKDASLKQRVQNLRKEKEALIEKTCDNEYEIADDLAMIENLEKVVDDKDELIDELKKELKNKKKVKHTRNEAEQTLKRMNDNHLTIKT